MEVDPFYVENAAAESAAKAEADRVQVAERELLRGKEALKIEHTMRNLDATILEISSAIEVAEDREKNIRSLWVKKRRLERERDDLANGIETDIGGLLDAIPEKQQHAIASAVAMAGESGVTIYTSKVGSDETCIVYRPSTTTMTEWFATWREKVTPSIIPFADRPLRALRAFEEDPRFEEAREVQRQLKELTKEDALFTDGKKANIAYIKRFLKPDSDPSALDVESLQLLSSAPR